MFKIPLCKVLQPVSQQASYHAAITENPDNEPKAVSGGRRKRAIGFHSKFWARHRWLTIGFLDNPPEELQDAIELIIWEWDPHVSLIFGLDKRADADIRISTNTDENGSYVGTDALTIEAGKPTMHLGCKPSDPAFKTTVLHEFGHALGLVHEHQHPQANIPWNKKKVYETFIGPNFNKDDIDLNILAPLDMSDLRISPYDKTSIMHYPIDKSFTDGTWEVGLNSKPSKQDIEFVKMIYPK